MIMVATTFLVKTRMTGRPPSTTLRSAASTCSNTLIAKAGASGLVPIVIKMTVARRTWKIATSATRCRPICFVKRQPGFRAERLHFGFLRSH
uniref:Secreted protein n=1 Tax=Panagrellus redivivus TaxID=6233 RepID=A0A7E4ZVV0_PANRE